MKLFKIISWFPIDIYVIKCVNCGKQKTDENLEN